MEYKRVAVRARLGRSHWTIAITAKDGAPIVTRTRGDGIIYVPQHRIAYLSEAFSPTSFYGLGTITACGGARYGRVRHGRRAAARRKDADRPRILEVTQVALLVPAARVTLREGQQCSR